VRVSLSLRIFLVHLVFTAGAAALAVVLAQYSFDRYKAEWVEQIQGHAPEVLFQPFANEVARSLLRRLEQGYPEEVQQRERLEVSEGLRVLLRGIPSVQSLLVVDREGRIMHASEPEPLGLGFTRAEDASFFAAGDVVRRPAPDGQPGWEVMVPIWDNPAPSAAAGDRRRLGSVVVRYRDDPALLPRTPVLRVPSIETRRFVLPLVLYLGAVAGGGVFIAALTGLPVRRLDRALREFRARGFRGGLHVGGEELQPEFASAVRAINEMGGRLEALDVQDRERQALLATLAQSVEDGMVAFDPQGVPVAWNEAALRLLTPAVEGTPDRAKGGPEHQRQRILEAVERNPSLSGPNGARSSSARDSLEIRRTDGSAVRVEVTRLAFEVGPGREGTLLLLRDLALLGRIEAHLVEAGRFAVLAHLAAGLAHEIRNPLHAIGLNAGVVEQYLSLEPAKRGGAAMLESLSSIKSETRRLTELLNNYLGLVRPERTAGPVEIPEICRRVRQLLAYAAARSGVEIRVAGDGAVPPVEGVAGQLQQAILNLVLNSIQAMPRGGVVSMETSVEGGQVVLTVSDTGPGLPRDLERELFDARITTKPHGTGLGLPLVRLIAEAHGGQISYRPRVGGGAAFLLRLPARAAA
jgi:signal transduction histidine kinase